MNFLQKPLAFIARHPWWTLTLAFVLFLLPTLALVLAGAVEVLRTYAVRLLGDFGNKLADWTEEFLRRSLWIASLLLFLIPPFWPIALVVGLWSAVDYLTKKGGQRADFSLSNARAAAAGAGTPGVGDDLFNSDDPERDTLFEN